MSLLRCKVVFDQDFSDSQTKHFHLRWKVLTIPRAVLSLQKLKKTLQLMIYIFLQPMVILFKKFKCYFILDNQTPQFTPPSSNSKDVL